MIRPTFVAICLALATSAGAGPLTLGTVSSHPTGAFWDHPSWDGPSLNIGELLGKDTPYLHDGSGQPDNWTFEGATDFTLTLEIAGYAPQNVFGLYSLALGWTPLFWGSDAPGATVHLGPLPAVTFWLWSPEGVWYTSGWGYEHFALFRTGGSEWTLGMEDKVLCLSDRDYNDMVVRFTEGEPVPEPATLGLLGLGLIVIRRVYGRNGRLPSRPAHR